MMFGKKVVYVASTSLVLTAKWNFSNQNGELMRFMPSVTYLLNPFDKNVIVLLKRPWDIKYSCHTTLWIISMQKNPKKLKNPVETVVFHDPITVFPLKKKIHQFTGINNSKLDRSPTRSNFLYMIRKNY